jgi:transcriptional regulator with XRE-family HTH domain
MNLGRAIKMCRTSRGLSQAELANRAQCSVSYLSLLENSQRDPALSVVEKISQGLNVPVGILFFLASDNYELAGINTDLIGNIARTALEFLNEPEPQSSKI